MKCLLIVFCIYVIGCNNEPTLDRVRYTSNLGGMNSTVEGSYKDSLEQGVWYVFDSAENKIEEGSFTMGIRNGLWKYKSSAFDTSIIWKPFQNKALGIKTNIPTSFSIEDEGNYYIKLQNTDPSKLCVLVIAIPSLVDSDLVIDSMATINNELLQEKAKGAKVTSLKLVSKSRPYFYTTIDLVEEENKILYFYGLIGKRIIEISLKYNSDIESFSRIIFASIISNLFIDSQRFLFPQDPVDPV